MPNMLSSWNKAIIIIGHLKFYRKLDIGLSRLTITEGLSHMCKTDKI